MRVIMNLSTEIRITAAYGSSSIGIIVEYGSLCAGSRGSNPRVAHSILRAQQQLRSMPVATLNFATPRL